MSFVGFSGEEDAVKFPLVETEFIKLFTQISCF
jgi:hypothetical protein